MRAAESATARGWAGVSLALAGGAGWFTTENILWLLPIAGSAYLAGCSVYYSAKLKKYKARIDLEIYKAKARKETGFDLPILNPNADTVDF